MKIFTILLIFIIIPSRYISSQDSSQVTEIPIIFSQTGQIILEAKINNTEKPAYFYFETNGSNLLRADQDHILSSYGIDPNDNSILLKKLVVGDITFSNTRFKKREKLGNRGNISFPDPIIGTIGPSIFNGKIIQLDFEENVLRIGEDNSVFEITDSAFSTIFRNSLINDGINLEFQTYQFGITQVAVDTRSPLGIHLYYSDISAPLRIRHKNAFKWINYKLNGEDENEFAIYDPGTIFIEDDIKISGENIWLSDYIPNSIGNGFLKHFRITIDFNNKIIFFDPITQHGQKIMSKL